MRYCAMSKASSCEERLFVEKTDSNGIDKSRQGLTLIELMVAVVVMAIMLALILVGVQKARESARRMSCVNNLRQIGLGVSMYESSYKCYPQAMNSSGSFLVAILPFTEQSNLANEVAGFVNSRQESAIFRFRSPLYLCSSDSASQNQPGTGASGSNYCGNSGTWTASAKKFDGIFQYLSDFGFGEGIVRARDVTDGLTKTGCVSEWLRADNTFTRLRVNWNTPNSYPMVREAAKTEERFNDRPKRDCEIGQDVDTRSACVFCFRL